ncbi:hypothetical protein SY88_20755 [Clostridiales bacterium PH28_bin88]|nr:hypothetical protein SY88_20755 [Clostridiales bacterium PH28_bin88]
MSIIMIVVSIVITYFIILFAIDNSQLKATVQEMKDILANIQQQLAEGHSRNETVEAEGIDQGDDGEEHCPGCGVKIYLKDRFCPACGLRLIE